MYFLCFFNVDGCRYPYLCISISYNRIIFSWKWVDILFFFLEFYMPILHKFKVFTKESPMYVANVLLQVAANPFIFGLKPYTDAKMNQKVAPTERGDLVLSHWWVHRLCKLPSTISLETYVSRKDWPTSAVVQCCKDRQNSRAWKWIYRSEYKAEYKLQ